MGSWGRDSNPGFEGLEEFKEFEVFGEFEGLPPEAATRRRRVRLEDVYS
jgi:hypothetical protein